MKGSAIYGGLYQWGEVMKYTSLGDYQSICPEGWHQPMGNEWIILYNFLGGNNYSGGKLKEVGFTHWHEPNTGATNENDFTALPVEIPVKVNT